MSTSSAPPRVAVVTGAAVGIGAAIAEALARAGAFVVTVDPGVAVDGSPQQAGAERTTVQRIVDTGGQARASGISVTDEAAVRDLFAGLVDEMGALDAVVNVAGITRPTGFATGLEDDWQAVLDVHLNGYLNVLRAALPIMAAAGHGRILGVTSGSGWRAADAGAYACAKRAVAALTWQMGKCAPSGVTVNALSPIAATRMVATALARHGGDANRPSTGGVALGMGFPPPEHLGPIGAYLVSEAFSWCNGQVIFSNGSEVTWVAPPRVLEAVRGADVESLPHVLDTIGPAVLAPAESAQATHGGGNPRLGTVFDEPAPGRGPDDARGCVVVSDSPEWRIAITDALTARGVECVGDAALRDAAGARGFAGAAEQLAAIARDAGAIDGVVLASMGGGAGAVAAVREEPAWRAILDEHTGVTEHIRADAAWVRAVSDYSEAAGRPIRLVTVGDATTAGGWSRAQASGQLARSAHAATADRVDAFSISVEAAHASARRPAAELAAYLVGGTDTSVLSGAELVVDSEWLGLRSHPNPGGTISFGGPEVPGWLDGALRAMVTGMPRPQP
ncbi:MAG TPA: SDR family NAD(P)-dependent oxidoreductase [Acidimicrobiia bacterium]|nr:SDR family NAD(P)-dependent oxidoreductase [Acidimicrobiia bacterium]